MPFWFVNQGLLFVAANNRDLIDEVILRDDYQTGIGVWFGAETGLIYHGYNHVRYCVELPSFLKVALAFTTGYGGLDSSRISKVPVVDLEIGGLTEKALREVFTHICLLYNSAHDFFEASDYSDVCFEKICNQARTGNRSFIKGCVEILDIRRFHPRISIADIV